MMKRDQKKQGSALLLVFWALILLSAAVFAFAQWVQRDIQLHADTNREVEAKAMSHSGMAIGLHPLVSQKTTGIEGSFDGGVQGYRVNIKSEGGKLNIRWLLEGEDPRKLMILKRWLESRGLALDEQERFVDSLLDWVDADDLRRLNGVEDDGDYHPANKMIQDVEEIFEVRNSEPLTKNDGWADDLTIYSQGPIDLTSASEAVLRMLPFVQEVAVQRFIQFRKGRDQIEGTLDDPEFKSLKEIQTFLGMGEQQWKQLNGLISIRDQTLNITSEGWSANVYRQVQVVVRKGGGNPQILSWKE